MPTMLEIARQVVAGELAGPPIAVLIGLRLTEIDRGHARIDFNANERHTNPMGTVHGGVLCDVGLRRLRRLERSFRRVAMLASLSVRSLTWTSV
jgi:hypothetical protein